MTAYMKTVSPENPVSPEPFVFSCQDPARKNTPYSPGSARLLFAAPLPLPFFEPVRKQEASADKRRTSLDIVRNFEKCPLPMRAHVSFSLHFILRKPSFSEVVQDREAWRLLENSDSL